MSGWLSNLGDILSQQSVEREEQRKAWEAALGPVAKFTPDSDPEAAARGFGVGYFVDPEGKCVVAIRRYANGYDPYSVIQYSAEYINMLHGLLKK